MAASLLQARSSGRPDLISDFADPPLVARRRDSQRQKSISSSLAGKASEAGTPRGSGTRTSASGSVIPPAVTQATHRRGSSGSITPIRSTGSTLQGVHGRSMSVSAIPDTPSSQRNGVLDSKAEKHTRWQARKEHIATQTVAYAGRAGAFSLGVGAAVGIPLLFTPIVGAAVGPLAGGIVAGVCTCVSMAPLGVPAYIYLHKHGKGDEALHDVHMQYRESYDKWKGRGKKAVKGTWHGTKKTAKGAWYVTEKTAHGIHRDAHGIKVGAKATVQCLQCGKLRSDPEHLPEGQD